MAIRPWNLRISDEGRAAWNAYAAEQGVTVHGLMEALALHLPTASRALPAGVLREARRIDAERRSRGSG